MGSLKRGPLAAFSDNSERFLCSEAPSWRFLTVLASLPSAPERRILDWVRALECRALGRCAPGITFPSVALLGGSLSNDIVFSGVSLSIDCLAPDWHRVLD